MIYADSLHPELNRRVEEKFLVCLSLLRAFYPALKLGQFVNRWTLVCTKEIEKQQDSISCGVFTCLNGYRFMTNDNLDSVDSDEKLQILQYWIRAKGKMAKPPIERLRREVLGREYAWIDNRFVDLDIFLSLPLGYLQMQLGKPAAKEIKESSIFNLLEELLKNTENNMHQDSDASEYDQHFTSCISRPVQADTSIPCPLLPKQWQLSFSCQFECIFFISQYIYANVRTNEYVN